MSKFFIYLFMFNSDVNFAICYCQCRVLPGNCSIVIFVAFENFSVAIFCCLSPRDELWYFIFLVASPTFFGCSFSAFAFDFSNKFFTTCHGNRSQLTVFKVAHFRSWSMFWLIVVCSRSEDCLMSVGFQSWRSPAKPSVMVDCGWHLPISFYFSCGSAVIHMRGLDHVGFSSS